MNTAFHFALKSHTLYYAEVEAEPEAEAEAEAEEVSQVRCFYFRGWVSY